MDYPRQDIAGIVVVSGAKVTQELRGQDGAHAELAALLHNALEGGEILRHEVVRLVHQNEPGQLAEIPIGLAGPGVLHLGIEQFQRNGHDEILDIGINEELASLFARALEVAEADKTAAQQYLSGIVLHIMGAVLAISQNKRYEVDNAAQKIESAKIIMHENVYKDIDPEELAMKLGISYSWFRKVFKEYTGYAPAKYFQELKLRKAKQLLIESSMSVKEICYELNYTSTEHFFSVFKKRTNFTPTEYRNFGRGGKEKENENE